MVWFAAAAAAEPCSPQDDTFGALSAVLARDAAEARRRLTAAEQAFGCSAPADPAEVARWFLIDAAVLELEKDPDAATDSWAAARVIAPDSWLPDLGSARRARWAVAEPPTGTGNLDVTPPGREVRVDGAVSAGAVPAGLHLVQVMDGSTAGWAEFVYVEVGVTRAVATPLAPVPAPEVAPVVPDPEPPPPAPVPRPSSGGPDVVARVVTGGSLALGDELRTADASEPAAKVVVPLLASAQLGLGPSFLRGEVGGGLLVGGAWLSTTAAGEVVSSPIQLLASGAVGVGDRTRAGVAGGIAWPARITARALAGVDRGPISLELRAGINVPTARGPELAGELVAGLRFGR